MKKNDTKGNKTVEELQVKLEERDKQIEEWRQKYLRALADYQNLEKRIASRRVEERKYAAEEVIEKFLPVIDTLTQAQAHVKDQGLDLAVKAFWSTLAGVGVRKIDAVGKLFDPLEMECVEVVEGSENKVIEELLSGYRLYEKVLRPAKVKVGKKGE